MKKRLLYALVVVFLATMTARTQDKGGDLLGKAKAGDYLVYKVTSKSDAEGFTFDGTERHVLTVKTDKQVRLELTKPRLGKSEFGLSLPLGDALHYFLFAPPRLGLTIKKGTEITSKHERIGERKEKVTIGDKNYDCSLVILRNVEESQDEKVVTELKVWLSPTVPLTGIVKMDAKSERSSKANPSKKTKSSAVMELTESGNQK